MASPNSAQKLNGAIQATANSNMWAVAFFALLGIFTYFLVEHFSAIKTNRQIFVPYGMATHSKEIEYSADFADSEDYLALAAMADAALWGNWKATTIKAQYRRFQKRSTVNFTKASKADLDAIAAENAKNDVTQKLSIIGDIVRREHDGLIIVPCLLESTVLGKEQPPITGDLEFDYVNKNGIPLINGFEFVEKDIQL